MHVQIGEIVLADRYQVSCGTHVGLQRRDQAAATGDLEGQVGSAPQPDAVSVHAGRLTRWREALGHQVARHEEVSPEHDLLAVDLEVGVGTPDAGCRKLDRRREPITQPARMEVDIAGEVAPDENQVQWRLVMCLVEPRKRLAVALERDVELRRSTGAQRARAKPEPEAGR